MLLASTVAALVAVADVEGTAKVSETVVRDNLPKEAIVLNTGVKLSSVVEMAPWTWNTSKAKPSLHLMGIPADGLANEAVVI